MKHIAILDFGSQYTHLISRSVRELNVLAKIYPNDISAKELINEGAIGIVISGGPQSVFAENSITVDKEIFNMSLPILGLCYGHQLIAHLLGGKVEHGQKGEYGRAKLNIENNSLLFEGIYDKSTVWMSHGDSVSELPDGFERIGYTDDCEITAMADNKNNIFGLQFHPEVEHSEKGKEMIENFVTKICKAKPNWFIKDQVNDLLENIKKQTGDKNVFILVSGGVDSSVALTLLTKALGEDRVKGLYIDTGFMRKDESREIIESYEQAGFHNLKMINADEKFFKRLVEIYDPEEKRHIIGQTFLDTKDEAIKELNLDPNNWLLGQGTIYPDTIESGGTKNADKIKTHHNRVDAVQELIEKGMVIEPLVDFYKDEVRTIGKLLGLPDKLINRHPFPGPGLAIRCLCHKNGHENSLESNIDKNITEILSGKLEHIEFSILPLRSVGVQGDNRTYANPLVVWNEVDWDTLDEISSKITNSIKEINRVLLLLNPDSECNFTIPKSNLYLTKERIKVLQEIDNIVMKHVEKAGAYNDIWQFPVILVPISNGTGKESIVLRPFVSRDVMTLEFARLKKELIQNITEDILASNKIAYVFYDLTNKPPGTVEWE